MSPTLTCLALALVGVDLGYQPTTNGKVEFIIQISPATLQSLRPGDPIELDAPREAQNLQPSHFTITMGDAPLPHVLPVPVSTPPAVAPDVAATRVMAAGASMPASPDGGPSGIGPQVVRPPGTSAANSVPLSNNSTQAQSTPAGSADVKIPDMQKVDSPSSQPRSVQWWMLMVLAVIALVASNGYIGWLFWETRLRYLGLLARTYSAGQT
jgi:hypothetical protein